MNLLRMALALAMVSVFSVNGELLGSVKKWCVEGTITQTTVIQFVTSSPPVTHSSSVSFPPLSFFLSLGRMYLSNTYRTLLHRKYLWEWIWNVFLSQILSGLQM
jgi:hypothetical protein